MSQNAKNQREKNVILISNPSSRGLENDLPFMYSRNSSFGSGLGDLITNGFARQSSAGTGNLFKTFNNTQKPKQQPHKLQQIQTEAQKYAQQCLEYQKYHFDDRIKLIIHRMAIRAYMNFKDKSQNQFLSFSIQKLLGIIAKKLLLNRFELLFLEYVFQQTKWKYDIQCISKHIHQFHSYAHISQSEGITDAAKKLQIYLLYCSFYSKKSLNEFPGQNIFNGYLKSLCPKFRDYFQEWTQHSNVSNIKINPKILNNIFKRLTFYSGRDLQEVENYCLLVEEIIQISPAYNAQKGQKPTKKRKANKQKQQDYLQQIKQKQSQMLDNDIPHQQQQILQESMPPSLRNKKQTSFLSNVDGLDAEVYIKGNQGNQRMI